MDNIKQVIVYRKDLKTRKGKFAAQCCHASTAAFLKAGNKLTIGPDYMGYPECIAFAYSKESDTYKWLENSFVKIVVGINNEEELLALYEKINKYNDTSLNYIPVVLITDNGRTEFHGVHTNTCIGVGPASNELIDQFTKHLPLL